MDAGIDCLHLMYRNSSICKNYATGFKSYLSLCSQQDIKKDAGGQVTV